MIADCENLIMPLWCVFEIYLFKWIMLAVLIIPSHITSVGFCLPVFLFKSIPSGFKIRTCVHGIDTCVL